jgi:hypothetical protein
MPLTVNTVFIDRNVTFTMASRGDNPRKPTLRLSQLPEVERLVLNGTLGKGSVFLLFFTANGTNKAVVRMVVNRKTTARASNWIVRQPAVGNPVSIHVFAVSVPQRLA